MPFVTRLLSVFLPGIGREDRQFGPQDPLRQGDAGENRRGDVGGKQLIRIVPAGAAAEIRLDLRRANAGDADVERPQLGVTPDSGTSPSSRRLV